MLFRSLLDDEWYIYDNINMESMVYYHGGRAGR